MFREPQGREVRPASAARRGDFKEDDPTMWRQAFRPTAAILSALMLCSAPALAGTVRFADVTSGGPARSAGDVRLRVASAAGQDTAAQQGPAASQTAGQQPAGSTPESGRTAAPLSTDGTLTQSGAGQVETVDLGDVTGTVCDCGIIPDTVVPRGGFPWWPLLGGAIVPFLFRGGDNPDTPDNPTPNTTPTPPPPAIPETATLLLFGTGLLAVGARARRRLAGKQAGEAEEV